MMSWRCILPAPAWVLFVLLLVPATVTATGFPCTTCHADKVRDKLNRTVHMAELADECETCHPPVSGLNHPRDKASVTVPPRASAHLCYRCHKPETARFIHAPVAAGECTACHVPHRSPASSLLRNKGAALCFGCHPQYSNRHRYGHGPVAGGNCLFCHDPHRSGYRKLLRKFGSDLCFDCHDSGLAVGVSVHEPVIYGECTGCHDIHGSPYRKILKGELTEEFYRPYERSRYSACFLCHTPELAEASSTALTGFRNGNYNLHYLHVNKGDRGRSCMACHEPHRADQEKLLMERVPDFGTWSIPMFFTGTATGGTCVVGCHKPKTYDRVQPVSWD